MTRTQVVPDQFATNLPIVPGVGGAVEAVVRAVMNAWGIPSQVGGLDDAAHAVADDLIERAGVWSVLELSVERDEVDLYVRLGTDVRRTAGGPLTRATRARVEHATGSHHVMFEGTQVLVVLQAAWR